MDIDEILEKATPGPWELRDLPSHGIEIWAPVNIGGKPGQETIQPIYDLSVKPQLRVLDDGTTEMIIAYESWRQFPSPNFQEMQKANARLIICAHSILRGAGIDEQT